MLSRVLLRTGIIPLQLQTIKVVSTKIIKYDAKNFCHFSVYSRNTIQCLPNIRNYSNQNRIEEVIVDYEYVKKATADKKILLIDVREPEELKEHGKIPNSINIPLGNVSSALGTMNDKEFEKTYHIEKPTEETEIIFYCMIGRRSGMAQQNAINLGYKNTKNYLGSWTDWVSKAQ